MSSISPVLSLFSPSDSDWIATIRTRDGRVINRRICPGTMSQEEAIRVAMNASEVRYDQLVDATARRAADASLVTERVDDHFERLMRRLR